MEKWQHLSINLNREVNLSVLHPGRGNQMGEGNGLFETTIIELHLEEGGGK